MSKEPVNLADLSLEERKKFREKYDVFFFDMDGTLATLSKEPLPGAQEAISRIAAHGKILHIFTDSCFYTREDLANSIRLRFPEFKKENVICASWLLTQYLKDIGFSKKIYAMGDPNGIIKELRNAGFQVEDDDLVGRVTPSTLANMQLDPEVGAVVLGADMNFAYLKLFKAVNYLRHPDSLFLITHTPIVAQFDRILPATGALAIPIEKICNKKPISCSKSSPESIKYIHSLGYDIRKCLFVGDGTVNDVACGNLSGMDTLLVLGGSSDLESVRRARQRGDTHHVPTYVADSVAVLGDLYAQH